MKITSIVLLFALKASIISADGGVSFVNFADASADAFADASDSPDCADFNIVTFGDCVGYCQSEYKSGMSATCPASGCENDGDILSCTCIDNNKNMLWKCIVPPPPPVSTTETCDEGGIITWDDCKDQCNALAAGVNSGMQASYTGAKKEVSSCSCKYGYDMTSSYDCTRRKKPYRPQRGVQDCADENIYDADSCNKYCTQNDLVAKAMFSGNSFFKCECSYKPTEGGNGKELVAYQCNVQSKESSYLRSG